MNKALNSPSQVRGIIGTLAMAFVCLLAGAAVAGESTGVDSLSQIAGSRVAVLKGTVHADAAKAVLSGVEIVEYETNEAMIAALLNGSVDAVIQDDSLARALVASNPTLAIVPEEIRRDNYAFAVRHYSEELLKGVNDGIEELKAAHVIDDMTRRWIDSAPDKRHMPDVVVYEPGETLLMGVDVSSEPFVYHDAQGELVGFDIELALRLASRLKKRLVLVEMEFAELIPALRSGKVDMIGAAISVTDERAKQVQFTESYLQGGIVAIWATI